MCIRDRSDVEEISQDHPALRRAMDKLAEASASIEVKRQSTNAQPSLDVFWRGFRGDAQSPDVNALGIGFAVPLGKSPRREPEIARAYEGFAACLLYTSPSPRDRTRSRMPS